MKNNVIRNGLISVIVPIYNVEKYIHKCIESIINQTYKNLEIILVDDGSPDNCGKICDEYARKDRRIKVVHKKNGGLSDARNAGIDISTGEYMAFIDSDDYISPDMIQLLYERLIEDKSDIALCNFLSVSEKGKPITKNDTSIIRDKVVEKNNIFIEFLGENYVTYTVACGKIYKAKLFDSLRYPFGKIHEDEFTTYKVLGECQKISCLSDALYYYVQRNGSITNNEYSIKKLDMVEALLERAQYGVENGIDIITERAIKNSIGYFMQGYKNLDMKDEVVKLRIKELKNMFNKIYFKAIKKVRSPFWKIAIFIFRINSYIYYILYSFIKKKGFKNE